MSLIVETGSGVAGANSYISLADAGTYHTDRGNAAWAAGSDADRTAALIRATFALDGMKAWRGVKASSSQPLVWPRAGAVDDDGYAVASDAIPQRLKDAVCEAALLELASAGALTPALDRGGAVTRVKVGPVEEEYSGAASARTAYAVIDGLLRGLCYAGSGVKLARG